MYRLFSWELSYFSGKARAYLRYKQRMGGLEPGYEDILATPELVQGLLVPKSGSPAVPQLLAPDGSWIQDSSEIIDFCEAAHPHPAVSPDPATHPRQALASYLIELLADEWLVVPGFWERWFFSEDGRSPSHRGFNEQQWGAVFAAGAPGAERRAAGAMVFEQMFGISDSRKNPKGVYAGLVHLGVTEETEHAWQASQHRVLGHLEEHFSAHDYVLGGRPSLGDFGLMGPFYAHLYRDAVSGFALRTHFPILCEWVERTNGEGAVSSRTYDQQLYSLGPDGELVGRPANGDGADWLPDDAIAETLIPVLDTFFAEMWPVLGTAMERLADFIASDAHETGGELPGKTFTATPGFEAHQTGDGALTHEYRLGDIKGRRMVVPYQMWMLGRLEDILARARASDAGTGAIDELLARVPGGTDLLSLSDRLEGCRVRKVDGRLFSVA
jgi:glutathione S-transferase